MRISDWSSDVCSSDLRCQIDDQARLEVLLRVPQRIAQHEAAFRIGVQHFDGLARHRGHHVARALRGAGRHVLHQAARSEEHTSELQSLTRISYAVFCLKKKIKV